MSQLIVIACAATAIAWVNWYFFIAGRNASSQQRGGDGQSDPDSPVVITVDGGYSPSTVYVRAGAPVKLVFDRKDTSSCSEEVVFPDFSIRQYLPTGKQTSIELEPLKAGRYEFMCGMSMLRGTLIAEERVS